MNMVIETVEDAHVGVAGGVSFAGVRAFPAAFPVPPYVFATIRQMDISQAPPGPLTRFHIGVTVTAVTPTQINYTVDFGGLANQRTNFTVSFLVIGQR